jgi:phenylalanyl-tRNA synthetase alpha chain
MNPQLKKIETKFQNEIRSVQNPLALEKIRIDLLGRKGLLNQLFKNISQIKPEEKKQYGQDLNRLKLSFEKLIQTQTKKLQALNPKSVQKTKKKALYTPVKIGHLHPITVTQIQINNLFRSLGFSIYDGPEIETDEYCFERLNVPKDHPSRGLQDSIYIKEPQILLRTQTSSVEARLLDEKKPPFRAAFPGSVYRNEKVNKSNHFIFHQYQGVVVDKNITLKDLIGTINLLFKNLYGNKVKVRYRCKYYPEVEPGMGLDLSCFSCQGQGCPLCKGAGWIELGGSGIIHPVVLKKAGIDPQVWSGFAFGLGLDRWVMAKYKITDIRTLLGGNLAYKPNQK